MSDQSTWPPGHLATIHSVWPSNMSTLAGQSTRPVCCARLPGRSAWPFCPLRLGSLPDRMTCPLEKRHLRCIHHISLATFAIAAWPPLGYFNWLVPLGTLPGHYVWPVYLATRPLGHYSLRLTIQHVHSGWPIHTASLLCQATWPFCLALLSTPPGYSTWPYDLSTLLSHLSWPTWLATLTNIFIMSVPPAHFSWATYQ